MDKTVVILESVSISLLALDIGLLISHVWWSLKQGRRDIHGIIRR